jgi:hypothetical protein
MYLYKMEHSALSEQDISFDLFNIQQIPLGVHSHVDVEIVLMLRLDTEIGQ